MEACAIYNYQGKERLCGFVLLVCSSFSGWKLGLAFNNANQSRYGCAVPFHFSGADPPYERVKEETAGGDLFLPNEDGRLLFDLVVRRTVKKHAWKTKILRCGI